MGLESSEARGDRGVSGIREEWEGRGVVGEW